MKKTNSWLGLAFPFVGLVVGLFASLFGRFVHTGFWHWFLMVVGALFGLVWGVAAVQVVRFLLWKRGQRS